MANTQNLPHTHNGQHGGPIPWREFRADTRMLTVGAVLTGAGALIAAAGTTVCVLALARASREWVRGWESTPGEMASRTLHQAQVAATAGRDAWRQQSN